LELDDVFALLCDRQPMTIDESRGREAGAPFTAMAEFDRTRTTGACSRCRAVLL
jgi:hypothetical protein